MYLSVTVKDTPSASVSHSEGGMASVSVSQSGRGVATVSVNNIEGAMASVSVSHSDGGVSNITLFNIVTLLMFGEIQSFNKHFYTHIHKVTLPYLCPKFLQH